jgi:hypothetical protein
VNIRLSFSYNSPQFFELLYVTVDSDYDWSVDHMVIMEFGGGVRMCVPLLLFYGSVEV